MTMTKTKTKTKTSLSFEAILAALAVLSSVTGGCSKSETAAPAPESNAATRASGVNAAAPPTPTAVVVPSAAATPSAAAAPAPAPQPVVSATAVDAGGVHRKSSASCGATGCSPDMKKNGK